MDFLQEDRYHELSDLLLCFIESDLDGYLEDKDVVRDYKKKSYFKDVFGDLTDEVRSVLHMKPFPAEVIGDVSNRYFRTEQEGRKWLTDILMWLEDENL